MATTVSYNQPSMSAANHSAVQNTAYWHTKQRTLWFVNVGFSVGENVSHGRYPAVQPAKYFSCKSLSCQEHRLPNGRGIHIGTNFAVFVDARVCVCVCVCVWVCVCLYAWFCFCLICIDVSTYWVGTRFIVSGSRLSFEC